MYEILPGTITNTAGLNYYKVAIISKEDCNTCAISAKCSFSGGTTEVTAYSENDKFEMGDAVLVRLNTDLKSTAIILFYVIPAVLLILLTLLGASLHFKDWQIFLLFVGGLSIYFFVLRGMKVKSFPRIIGRNVKISQGSGHIRFSVSQDADEHR